MIVPASGDDVRTIGRRRKVDETTLRLTLMLGERGTAWAARDDGDVVGVVVACDTQEERYVGDLFVEPSFRNQGIGVALLEAAFANDERDRAMLVNPDDPAALTLAIRFGMAAREPLIRFAGAMPKEEELAKMAAGDYRFEVAPIDAATHAFALDELDRRTRGTTRPADHAAWTNGANGYAFFLNGEFVAYAYVWPDGRVGPLAASSPAYLVQILGYALAALSRTYGASWCTLLVPCVNRRVARAALRAGLRMEETLLFAADAFLGEMSTYIGYHPLIL